MMKHYYFRLMLLLALTWLVPKANAQVTWASSTPVATHSTSGWSGSSGNVVAQIAVTNDVVYTIMTGGKRISYWNATTDTDGSYSYDSDTAGAFGPGICTDDSGNLVFASGPSYSSRIQQISVVSKSSANGVVVDFANKTKVISLAGKYTTVLSGGNAAGTTTTNADGLTNVIRASGNCYNGEGALWLTNGQKVVKIPIINGVAQTEIVYSVPLVDSNGTFGGAYGGSHNDTWSTESNIFPYANGKYMLINRNGTFLCELSGSEFDGTEYINNLWYLYNAADIQYIGGYEVIAHQATEGTSGRDGKITVVNRTGGTTLASGIYAYGSSGTLSSNTAVSAINVWCEFSPIESGKYGLYTYTPGLGFAKYIINYVPTDPVQNLAVEVVKDQDPNQLSRQDAVLTWQAPASGTVSKYEVLYRTRYTMPGQAETINDWSSLGTTTETTFTQINVQYRQYSSKEYERHYDYKVIPIFESGSLGAESDVVTATPDLLPFVPIWDVSRDYDDIKAGIDRYDGYCKVQLYWKFPMQNKAAGTDYTSIWGLKPDYYSILRNGVEIATGLTSYNYIDLNVKSEKSYTYQVVSHYNSFPNDTAVSTPNTVYVEKRDWAKVGYELTEIYNYYVASEGNNVVKAGSGFENFATTGEDPSITSSIYAAPRYKQGVYYDGYWYIAQDRNSDGTSSGIIKFSASDPSESATENILTSGTKIYTGAANASTGIACDEGGNLYVAYKSILPNDYTGKSYTPTDNFAYIPYSGVVLMRNSNGGYPSGPTQSGAYIVDLTGIDFDEYRVKDWTVGNVVPGRVDYYHMKGDLSGGTASNPTYAYLYMAPHDTYAVYVIQLKFDGTKVTASEHYSYSDGPTPISKYVTGTLETSISKYTGQTFQWGEENYAYPVMCKGRENEFIHQLRSVAHSAHACHTDADKNVGRITTIYDSQSRVNNAGGITIEYNGELMIITPQSQHSINTGNFYIGMAERGDGETAADADFGHIIPVAMWSQKDIAAQSGTYSNANCLWLGAEKAKNADGTILDENGDGEADYLDIYLYSPARRFAKYRLTPSTTFPPSQVKLTVAAQYAEDYDASNHNPGDDIERFDATASWTEVLDYGVTSGGNVYYRIKGYTLQLVDASGNLVDDTDAEGNLLYPMIEFDVDENGVPTTIYTITINDGVKTRTAVSTDSEIYKNLTWTEVTRVDADGNVETDADGNEIKDIMYSYVYKDVEKDINYTAQVTVNYIGVDESNAGVEQKSAQTEYEDVATYTPVAPSGNVLVKVDEDRWSDWDADYQGNPTNGGAKDADDAYYDNYRICFDIENPDFGSNRVEPVTNYTISYNDGTNTVPVDEFFLYVGLAEGEKYTITGTDGTVTEYTVDHDGYIKITNGQIPGDYNFDSINTGGKPHVYWDMQDYTSAPGYDDGVNFTSSNNPSTWSYIVTANYAANNARISEVAPATMGTDGSGITTGVEIISTQSRLNIYPIPATITITIKCSEAIETVEIYSASGLLVKTVEGNADQVMTVDVSDLASGYYFMRVNNLAPVKIVKR